MRNGLVHPIKTAIFLISALFFSVAGYAYGANDANMSFAPVSLTPKSPPAPLPPPDTFGYVNHKSYHRVEPCSEKKSPWFKVEKADSAFEPSRKPVSYMNESQHKAVIAYAMKNPLFRSLRNSSVYHHVEVFLLGGAAFSSLNNNTTVVMDNFFSNEYFSNNNTTWGGLAGIGGGYVFPLAHHDFSISVDPTFYYAGSHEVTGIEYPVSTGVPFNGGNADSLNYQFSTQSYAAMFESHFVYDQYSWQPVLIVGVGMGRNDLSNYSELPTDQNSGATVAPAVFRNQTNTSFAYEIGVAIQHQIYADDKHDVSYNASLGYRYFNFGEGALAQSTIQTGTDTLKVNSLSTQAILLSLSAAFD